MRKVLFASLFLSFVLFAGEYRFPGWACRDLEKLETAAENAPTPEEMATCAVLYEFNKRQLKDYASLVALIDEICDDTIAVPAKREKHKLLLKKQFPVCRGQFLADAWKFALQNPSGYDYYLAMNFKEKSIQRYKVLLNTLSANFTQFTPAAHLAGVKEAIELGKFLQVKTMKDDFSKINRTYTALRKGDEKSWAPVCAEIDKLTQLP